MQEGGLVQSYVAALLKTRLGDAYKAIVASAEDVWRKND